MNVWFKKLITSVQTPYYFKKERSIKKVENARWITLKYQHSNKTVKSWLYFNHLSLFLYQIEFTRWHVWRDAVKSPKNLIKLNCCEQTIMIGNERWISIGNRYHWHFWKISMSSNRLCSTSIALQTTSNGIITDNVKAHSFKIAAALISDFI